MFALFQRQPTAMSRARAARRVERACMGLSRSDRRRLVTLLRDARDGAAGKQRAELRESVNAFLR